VESRKAQPQLKKRGKELERSGPFANMTSSRTRQPGKRGYESGKSRGETLCTRVSTQVLRNFKHEKKKGSDMEGGVQKPLNRKH